MNAVKENNSNAYIHYLIGYCYSRLNKFQDSFEYYNKSISIDSTYNYQELANDFYLQKKFLEAEKYNEKAFNFGSDIDIYITLKAVIYLETNRLDDCIKLYSDIIEMHPSRINSFPLSLRN